MRVDIGWRNKKVAVFIDGCYWHACPMHGHVPKSNEKWWREKFDKNRLRDQRANALLREAGWLVLRYWEHEPPEAVVSDIIRNLEDRKQIEKRAARPTRSSRGLCEPHKTP